MIGPLGRGLTPLGGARAARMASAALFARASSQYLEAADSPTLSMGVNQSFTLAAWVYLTTKPASTEMEIFAKDRFLSGWREYRLYIDVDGGVGFAVLDGAAPRYSTTTASIGFAPAAGAWFFLAAWYDDSARTINIQPNNGGVKTLSAANGGAADGVAPLRLGARYEGSYLDGRVQHAAIWKRVLSAGERTALYNGGNGLSDVGAAAAGLGGSLTAWWRLDEASGNRADAIGASTLTSVAGVGQTDGWVT